ncbi:hypothetical protein EMCRGX_G028832 [Ephydatia muelleri]
MRKDGNGIGSNKVEIQTPIEFMVRAAVPVVTLASKIIVRLSGDVTDRSEAAGLPRTQFGTKSMMAKWLQGNLRAQWAARTMGNIQAKPLFNGNLELGRVEMETKTVTDSHDAA